MYDPFGRRIQKASAGGTTNYVYDGANIVAEFDATGTLVARYSQGQGIDQPLAVVRQGTAAYYNADGLGSITSLRDVNGGVVATYSYDAFGNTTATSSINNPFQYTGREWDSETGLYYYRARYYEPSRGRFLSTRILNDIHVALRAPATKTFNDLERSRFSREGTQGNSLRGCRLAAPFVLSDCCEHHLHDFAVGLPLAVEHRCAVHIHRRLHACMSHQLLLNATGVPVASSNER
jgi:RHS repeat-associated protein